jgi:hypothetical protein
MKPTAEFRYNLAKSPSAKKFAKWFEDATREGERFLGCPLELLSKRPLLATVDLASAGWHLVGGQIDVIRRPGRIAARRGELIRDW